MKWLFMNLFTKKRFRIEQANNGFTSDSDGINFIPIHLALIIVVSVPLILQLL